MRPYQRLTLTTILLGLGFIASGCPKDGALENAGEELDEAANDAGRAIEDATD